VQVSASSPAENPPPAPEPAPPIEVVPAPALTLEGARSHRVVWGDTLSSLAKRYYGSANGYYFPLILLASDKVVLNPDVILPGMTLTIPDLDRNLANPQSRIKIKSFLRETASLYDRKRDTRTRDNLIRLANSL
jgi:LysM repeat protein